MAQKKKTTVMGASYKDALEQKKLDSFRKQAREAAKTTARKPQITSVKSEPIDRQRKIALLEREIAKCRPKLEEAESAVKNDVYGFFGTMGLIIFGVLTVSGILLYLRRTEPVAAISLMAIGGIAFIFSIIAQMMAMDAEKKVSEYSAKIRKLSREISALKGQKTPPQ